MNQPHRKQKVSFNLPGHAHFLTFSCFQQLPLLSKDRSRGWVIEAMLTARESMNLDLWAYVIMPEHVHLLIRPRNKDYKMGHILAALKRPVSAKAKAYMVATNNTSWLDRLTVHEGKQVSFRFWQAGGGYDENLTHERSLEEVIAYIHGNPVRRGLVEQGSDWYWSSARYWEGDLSGPLIMDSLDGSA